MALKITVKRPADLTDQERGAWESLRSENAALYSPYFHVDYTRFVGALRNDAYVAIAKDHAGPIAFFPYQGPQPGKSGFARPIGAPMTDYHGFICAPGVELDHLGILKSAGIGAFHYSALIDSHGSLSGHHTSTDVATVMDISDGADNWRTARDSSYRRSLKSHRRRIRKAEADIGPRRFEFNSRDKAVFDQLIAWKKEKFALTGKYDVLSAGWTLDLIMRLWAEDSSSLRCDMHVLYFGDRVAAIDLGLSDGPTFHSWIVAYDSDLHTYAPGLQLLEALIDEAGDLGYERIDLGASDDGYKRHYATEPVTVGSGFIAANGPAAALSQLYGQAEKFGKKALKDAPGKLRRRYSQIAACDDSLSGRAKAMISAVKSSGS